MVRVSEALLEREVLDGSEVIALIEGKELAPLAPVKTSDDEEGEKVDILKHPKTAPGLEGSQPSPA